MWILKATLLLVLVFALAASLRRASAAARHLVWSVGLTAVLLIPLMGQAIPWRLSVLPTAPQAVTPATPAGVGADPSVESRNPAPPVLAEPGPVAREAAMASSGTSPAAGESGWQLPSWAQVIAALPAIWVIGVTLVLGRLVLGMVAIKWVARRGEAITDRRWAETLAQVKTQLGFTRDIRLVRSGRVTVPFTAGILFPVVVLPTGAAAWPLERLHTVLLHELAHVRRRDIAAHLISQAACAVYWFHPLVWIAAGRLRSECERACDDLVLGAGTKASEYAEHLLHIVRSAARSWAPAAALPMARRSEFEGRLLAILEADPPGRPLGRRGAAAIVSAVAMFALPLAALAPTERASAEAATPPIDEQIDEQVAAPSNAVDPAMAEPEVVLPQEQAAFSDEEGVADSFLADSIPSVPRDEPRAVELDVRSRPQQAAPRSPVGALVVALGDPDARVRSAAAMALGSYQDTTAVAALSRALRQDDDPDVRRTAAWALGELEDPRGIPALSDALRQDANPAVRAMAAWALGEIEDPRGIPALAAALANDSEPRVREAAIEALGDIEDPSAISALTPALSDPDPQMRARAARALGDIDDPRAIAPLTRALADDDIQVRRTAAWALGEIEDGRAVEPLVRALGDNAVEVRVAAIRALGEIEDGRAVQGLLPLLQDADAEVRRVVLLALGEIEDVRAIDAIGSVLRTDAEPRVRAAAAWALGEIESSRSADDLAAALADQSVEVRRRAASALGELDELARAPAPLIAALRDSDLQVRRLAARALGEIEDPAAVDGLQALLQDENTEVRRTAIWALSEIHHPKSYEVLVAALQDEDPEIRRLAARALGNRR